MTFNILEASTLDMFKTPAILLGGGFCKVNQKWGQDMGVIKAG